MDQTNGPKLTGLKKRQQIQKANKMILVWVAAASVIVSMCLVALQFLVREALFNNEVISAKIETNETLKQNIENAKTLKTNVNNLLADKNLASVRADPSDSNLKVILDALPATGDSTTFANSLQNVILNRSGVKVVGLSAGDTAQTGAETALVPDLTADPTSPQPLVFTADISGGYDKVKTTLQDMEKVIRPIHITSLTVTGTDQELTVSISGVTYYLPEKTVKLGTKSIKRQ